MWSAILEALKWLGTLFHRNGHDRLNFDALVDQYKELVTALQDEVGRAHDRIEDNDKKVERIGRKLDAVARAHAQEIASLEKRHEAECEGQVKAHSVELSEINHRLRDLAVQNKDCLEASELDRQRIKDLELVITDRAKE